MAIDLSVFEATAVGAGRLVLIGGGEFSFGETYEADRLWLADLGEGPVGFVPAASGSSDYGRHLADYLEGEFGRAVVTVPIYRSRDARRAKNVARLEEAAAVYLGGGVADQLLEALAGSAALAALERRLRDGGTVVAIAAAAHALGAAVRGLGGGATLPGFGWLGTAAVEANFEPAHDRRLRRLLETGAAERGLALPAGSAVAFGPGATRAASGPLFAVAAADGDVEIVTPPAGRSE